MALKPSADAILDAEVLVHDLKAHDGSAVYQARLMRQLEQLRCRLETGFDALMFHTTPMLNITALNVMLDFGVFDAVPLEGSIGLEDLGAAVGLDPNTLYRFLRVPMTQGLLTEHMPGVFGHTASSRVFRNDHAADLYRLGTMQLPQWYRAAEYLRCHSAADARDVARAPYSWALGREGLTYFEAIDEDAAASDVWHKAMVTLEAVQPVTGMFEFAAMRSAVEAEPGRAFVVDVGGGRGNALKAVLKECGGSYGARMVLQDLGEVLTGNDPVKIEGVDVMLHNFYDRQPVRNAHIYLTRFVLHNHYDDRSLKILRNIAEAMGPTSRLLIGEMILPTVARPGVDPFPFVMDLCMFMEGGLERDEEQFRTLLREAGLELRKVWRHADNPNQATIEAGLLQ